MTPKPLLLLLSAKLNNVLQATESWLIIIQRAGILEQQSGGGGRGFSGTEIDEEAARTHSIANSSIFNMVIGYTSHERPGIPNRNSHIFSFFLDDVPLVGLLSSRPK